MRCGTVARGAALAVVMAAGAAASGAAFTAGNIVVLTAGDGSATLSSAATPIFLNEFTPSGTLVQTIPMPTAAGGSMRAFAQSGSATSEGALSRSADGHYLILVGYDATPGITSIASTSPAAINRVIARVAVDGSVDTSTAISDAFGSNNIRGGASIDGTGFWVSGPGSASVAGVRYVTLGVSGGTSVAISAVGAGLAANTRNIAIFSNQLYVSGSTTSGPLIGVGTVGTPPPPTTGPATITELSGMATASGPSNYGFWFSDANTLYVTDDRASASGGGIQKWTFDSGSSLWTLQYTLNGGLTTGARAVTGQVSAGVVTLYTNAGVGTAASGNTIYTVTDTGAASAYNQIVGPTANMWYRGIEFAPANSSPPPCYANCDESTNTPLLNVADFTCFLQKFSLGNAYANCDGSTSVPTLNVADFTCFLQKFAQGCP
jgi:hypothetical protein